MQQQQHSLVVFVICGSDGLPGVTVQQQQVCSGSQCHHDDDILINYVAPMNALYGDQILLFKCCDHIRPLIAAAPPSPHPPAENSLFTTSRML